MRTPTYITVLKTNKAKRYVCNEKAPNGSLFFCPNPTYFWSMFYKPKVTHYTVDQARQRIENYCAYQERCHSEVVAKLREMGMIDKAVDQIVSELIASNYLNEQRFAIQFSLGKFRIKNWGKLRIERELKSRNLSAFTIKKALEALENEGYEKKFVEVFSKKLELLGSIPASQKQQKLIRYLQYRGWENDLIFEHIKQIP